MEISNCCGKIESENMVNSTQQELINFYKAEFDAMRQTKIFTDEQADELSAPFLLKVNENYFSSVIRVMYVGKETNGWRQNYNNFNEFLNDTNGVEQMLIRYKREISEERHWNNRFFVEYKKIRKALTDNKKGSVVWNNLLKMDFKQKGKGYSRNSINHSEQLRDISRRFFTKELELLEPHFIIFATSHTYDSVIKDFLPQRETIEVIEKRALWKFRNNGSVCYRTWHPQTIKFKSAKTIPEYYQMIIEDIKRETTSVASNI
jgi:hypothetical protein